MAYYAASVAAGKAAAFPPQTVGRGSCAAPQATPLAAVAAAAAAVAAAAAAVAAARKDGSAVMALQSADLEAQLERHMACLQ